MVNNYEEMAKLSYVSQEKNPHYNWTYPEKTPNPVCIECGKECTTEEDKAHHSARRLCEEHGKEYTSYLRKYLDEY